MTIFFSKNVTTRRVRLELAKLKKRALRSDPGTAEGLKALAASWLANPIHDIVVRASDLAIGDGNRRVLGLELLGETEADVTLLEGDVSDLDLDRMALVSAYHRAPLGGYDQARILHAMREAQPGVTNKALAEELHIDPSMPTMLLALFDHCLPEVQAAAQAGQIGVTHWYAIRRSPDQLSALRDALNGSSRDELQRRSRQHKNGNGQAADPQTRIKIPVATDDAAGTVALSIPQDGDLAAVEKLLTDAKKAIALPRVRFASPGNATAGTVTVARESIDPAAAPLLKEAIKIIQDAKARKLSIEQAQLEWDHIAKAARDTKAAQPGEAHEHPDAQP
jgi:hypothetical protein